MRGGEVGRFLTLTHIFGALIKLSKRLFTCTK
jgi:hypothetical protein